MYESIGKITALKREIFFPRDESLIDYIIPNVQSWENIPKNQQIM